MGDRMMKTIVRTGAALLMLLMLGGVNAQAEVERSELLDTAFSMLEKDNAFLLRYNELTGANVEARFEYGLPYFYGGKHDQEIDGVPLVFTREPEYAKRVCWETTHFYRKDAYYLYGFDCSGYTQWIYDEVGYPEHPKLDQMILNYGKYGKKNHIFTHRKGQEMPPFDELASHLVPGDLLVGKLHRSHLDLVLLIVLVERSYLIPLAAILQQTPAVNVRVIPASEHHRVVSIQCPLVHSLHALRERLAHPERAKYLILRLSALAEGLLRVLIAFRHRHAFVHHSC